MTLTDHDLSELLAALKAGEVTDTIRTSLEWILQQLIEAEATAFIGAAPHERTESRVTQRNGHRPRLLSTPAGDVELEIPKLRQGSFFPSLLGRCRPRDGRPDFLSGSANVLGLTRLEDTCRHPSRPITDAMRTEVAALSRIRFVWPIPSCSSAGE